MTMKKKICQLANLFFCDISLIFARNFRKRKIVKNMMKKIYALIFTLFVASAAMAQDTLVVNRDCAKGVQLVKDSKAPIMYDYVDLGLPSGLKWATSNVGAANPWDYGDYFAWGETVGYGKSDPSNAHNKSYTGGSTVKTYYFWDTYKYCSGTSSKTLTKYNYSTSYGTVDNKYTLDLSDDAARVNMGGSWRMPTYDEQRELINNCYWEWTSSYSGKGVEGYIVYKVKSASDKGKVMKYSGINTTTEGRYSRADPHIFLPAVGWYCYDSRLYGAGDYGSYWSSSLYDSSCGPYGAYYLDFNSGIVSRGSNYRYYGQSVRAVVE